MRINPASLRRARKEQRLSVTDLAALASELATTDDERLTRSHLSNIEHGHRAASPAHIRVLAAALNCSPYALLGPENPKLAIRELVELYRMTPAELFPGDGEEAAVA